MLKTNIIIQPLLFGVFRQSQDSNDHPLLVFANDIVRGQMRRTGQGITVSLPIKEQFGVGKVEQE